MKVLHLLALGGMGGIESLCVDIAKYSSDTNYFYFLWGGGENTELIKQYTSNVVVRTFKYSVCYKEYKYFEQFILENRIDCVVVQGMSPMMLMFAGVLKKRCRHMKSVIYLHTNAERCLCEKWRSCLFTWACNHVNGCIAISESVKESFKVFCKKDIIHVIYNGIDIDKFQVNAVKDEGIRLIFVGRLIKDKGVDLLLNALKYVNTQAELIVVGEGEEKENLIRLVNVLNLEKCVKFVGAQWNVAEWISRSDIFVHPAICKEGFGLSIVEAMACGVPCIAFERGAVPEIITNNINGYLVSVISAEALGNKLNEVINQIKNEKNKYMSIAENARKRAEDFGIKRYVGELSGYLRNLEED